jgi:hypothetical protein
MRRSSCSLPGTKTVFLLKQIIQSDIEPGIAVLFIECFAKIYTENEILIHYHPQSDTGTHMKFFSIVPEEISRLIDGIGKIWSGKIDFTSNHPEIGKTVNAYVEILVDKGEAYRFPSQLGVTIKESVSHNPVAQDAAEGF